MCGFYASALMTAANLVTVDAQSAGSDNAMGVVLSAVATVFIAVAVYVAAVVIANGVDTVVAGRLRQIAVLRLLGADARSLRAAVVRGATSVAAVGAVVGVLAGALVGDVVADRSWWPAAACTKGTTRGSRRSRWPPRWSSPCGAAVAAWVGSRVVLRATPGAGAAGCVGAAARDTPARPAAAARDLRADRLRRASCSLLAAGAR